MAPTTPYLHAGAASREHSGVHRGLFLHITGGCSEPTLSNGVASLQQGDLLSWPVNTEEAM